MQNDPKQRLILALDVSDFDEARRLIDRLGDAVEIYKVGYQLFVAYGPFVVRYLQAQGRKVFLDLKFHDIPNTVSNALSSAVGLSVPPHDALKADGQSLGRFAPLFMATVHTQGGAEMMKAAAEAARKRAAELKVDRPLVVGVTVLTSDAATEATAGLVLDRARLAKESGLDGVVASVKEAAMLRREMGKDFVIVTPGIRPAEGAGSEAGDQKRVDTPAGAIKNGSSFLVVGRPIVKAADPKSAAESILSEIAAAL
ncbi:MAG: orotidine-5'-phosphate decarboxylase [Candidatus Omnitrophica bacterium]|nr:orotidine-5'-phosphate decarboxylase [Candidatus Omnitrophota bacterium]